MKKVHVLVLAENNIYTTHLTEKLKQHNYAVHVMHHYHRKVKDVFIDHAIEVVFTRFGFWNEELRCILCMLRQQPRVVFLSSLREKYSDYAAEEFGLHLTEPYTDIAFKQLLWQLQDGRTEELQYLVVKYQRRYRKIPFDTIRCISSKGGYITLQTTKESMMIAGSMVRMIAQLPPERFVKVSTQLILAKKGEGSCKW